MRIISLLPSATEIVVALGLSEQLVAISHECDYPREVVANKPIITRSAVPGGLSSSEVDRIVSERICQGESLYLLDEDLLDELQPDLILTQELCKVCAVSSAVVRDAVCKLSSDPRVLSLEPTNLAGIVETIHMVAAAAGVPERAVELERTMNARLAAIATRLEGLRDADRPRVYAMEWLLPPFSAGHWVPEMVELAGGRELVAKPGERSVRLDWDTVIRAQPDMLVLMPCGYSVELIERELLNTRFPSEWWDIPAVRRGNLYAVDANAYFSRPAPRFVEGIELLASLFHPDLFDAPAPQAALRLVQPLVAA